MNELEKNGSLELEVKIFAESLPYWTKYLAYQILSGNIISEVEINKSYLYLLEELKLIDNLEKSEITINYNPTSLQNYKSDLLLLKLENVEGVNALLENQTIEFSPNMTIIYGANGSGKSGYVRLLKKAFYSKSPEAILSNIHLEDGDKPINASFTFSNSNPPLKYPENEENSEFEQFAVFDGKSVLRHLDQKNEFEFRPAGLGFFGDFSEAVKNVESKLNSEILNKQNSYKLEDLSDLLEGESEIKTFVQKLNSQTKIDELLKYTPFSEEDKAEKIKIEKQYDELFLASKGKEKEIQTLESIKKLLNENKTTIESINQYFTSDNLLKIKESITDSVNMDSIAKAEGIENFKTDKIIGIGTIEWKNFILAAEIFAKNQKVDNIIYPENADSCLLCLQPLSEDASKLIINYWSFIKSIAEENAKKSQLRLEEVKEELEKLNFDLFPNENTLTVWLTEKYPIELTNIKQSLSEQKKLSETIINDIKNKTINDRIELKTGIVEHQKIELVIDNLIKIHKEDELNKELDRLLKEKNKFIHKEKFNLHFIKFDTYVKNQSWIKNANKANFSKRKITEVEKSLSDRFFNQRYVESFNSECEKLNGNFGIEINHTGSAGKSYRQLRLKGKNPNAILSEGEQKVIATADFIAEMEMSEINVGIIFDDPVTSLDHERREKIAQRLVEEALKKQVIIFTHDISFLMQLQISADIKHINYGITTIRKVGSNIGMIKPNLPWVAQKVKDRIAFLRNDLVKLKSMENQGLEDEYNIAVKGWHGLLREAWERAVEERLFKGVIERFGFGIQTQKLKKLDITPEMLNSIETGMTESSKWVHDQAMGLNPTIPNSSKVEADLNFFDEFAKKCLPA